MHKLTRSSYFWNHSSELDTLVNQNSHAAPIRSLVRGRTGFQNRGVCGQALPSFPSPTPLLPLFCSRPIFARPECESLFRSARISFTSFGNACYAGYHRRGVTISVLSYLPTQEKKKTTKKLFVQAAVKPSCPTETTQ